MKPNLKSLRKGDIIKGHRTMKVTGVNDGCAHLVDVLDGQTFTAYQEDLDKSSWNFEMVKVAAPLPKVGDTVTGEDLKSIPMRRGTVLVGVSGHVFVLTSEGEWFSPAKYENKAIEVDEYISVLPSWGQYRILRLP